MILNRKSSSPKMRHIGIVVSSPEVSKAFYEEFFGFKTVVDQFESGGFLDAVVGIENVKIRTIKMTNSHDEMIELLHYLEPNSQQTPGYDSDRIGISHIAFTVDDIEKISEALSNKGHILHCKPQISPDGKVKLLYCRAPEGTILELVEPTLMSRSYVSI